MRAHIYESNISLISIMFNCGKLRIFQASYRNNPRIFVLLQQENIQVNFCRKN